jgi:hypothetical protein
MAFIRLLPDVSSFLSEFKPPCSPHPRASVMLALFIKIILLVQSRDT